MTILRHRWWSHDDLRHTDEWIWPVELVELWSLVGAPERWPVDLGTQEESTARRRLTRDQRVRSR